MIAEQDYAGLLEERDKLEKERDEARRAHIVAVMQYEGECADDILVLAARFYGGREVALRLFTDEQIRSIVRMIDDDMDDYQTDDEILADIVVHAHEKLDEEFPEESP